LTIKSAYHKRKRHVNHGDGLLFDEDVWSFKF